MRIVVAAFHNVAAHKLQNDEADRLRRPGVRRRPEGPRARDGAGRSRGLRGVHAGPLANSVAAEALTSVLIGINRNYKVDGAGIRITGIGS